MKSIINRIFSLKKRSQMATSMFTKLVLRLSKINDQIIKKDSEIEKAIAKLKTEQLDNIAVRTKNEVIMDKISSLI